MRRTQRNEPAAPGLVVAENDVLLTVAASKELLASAAKLIGEPAPGRVVKDRSDLDYIRVFVSNPTVVGRTLGDLEMPGDKAAVVVHVRRGDTDLMSRPDLVLEFGDRIGLLANRGDFVPLRKYFGDSIKGTTEFSYISIGLGMALGFLVGALAIPIPGIGKIAIGFAGVLLVALILGKQRRTGGINWTMPLSANLVLRNLGLTLFLAQVGMASGPKFVDHGVRDRVPDARPRRARAWPCSCCRSCSSASSSSGCRTTRWPASRPGDGQSGDLRLRRASSRRAIASTSVTR